MILKHDGQEALRTSTFDRLADYCRLVVCACHRQVGDSGGVAGDLDLRIAIILRVLAKVFLPEREFAVQRPPAATLGPFEAFMQSLIIEVVLQQILISLEN